MQRAYTSTVFGGAYFAVGALCALAFGALTLRAGAPVWVLVMGVAVIVLGSVHLSTVRLSIGSGMIRIGQGPWNRRCRGIPVEAVASATDADLRWPQVFGVGIRFHRKAQRLTVRPGPTLCLQLTNGEYLRISTKHPDAARSLLPATREEEA